MRKIEINLKEMLEIAASVGDKIMRDIKVDLSEILDVACSAENYGINSPMLMSSLYEWANPVTEAEIREFADSFLSKEGYGQEDVDSIFNKLTEWRDRYKTN